MIVKASNLGRRRMALLVAVVGAAVVCGGSW